MVSMAALRPKDLSVPNCWCSLRRHSRERSHREVAVCGLEDAPYEWLILLKISSRYRAARARGISKTRAGPGRS
eukprot:6485383-Amphidinium_carterae.1